MVVLSGVIIYRHELIGYCGRQEVRLSVPSWMKGAPNISNSCKVSLSSCKY